MDRRLDRGQVALEFLIIFLFLGGFLWFISMAIEAQRAKIHEQKGFHGLQTWHDPTEKITLSQTEKRQLRKSGFKGSYKSIENKNWRNYGGSRDESD